MLRSPPLRLSPVPGAQPSLAVMLWTCPAACRIVPRGSKLACCPWHRAQGSYTFTHIFTAFNLSANQRGNQAASPCSLPKGSLNWWGMDVGPEGKGEETPASTGQHPKYLPTPSRASESGSPGAGAAPSEAEMSMRLPASQHRAGSATAVAPTWADWSPGAGRASLRGGRWRRGWGIKPASVLYLGLKDIEFQ